MAGHSRGGDGLIAMSWRLYSAGVPVALAVAFNSTRAVDQVPPNVERFINLYQSSNGIGGGAARPASDFRSEYATVNLADHCEMNHITIDKMLTLHHAILPKFLEAVSLGSPPGSGGVPIEYRVPALVPIEVWDSGVLVRADPGDTASSVAHQFSVPTWVIAQLNQLAPGEPIEPGRTLIIPRSAALNRMFLRSCIPQTRTCESGKGIPNESKRQIWTTRVTLPEIRLALFPSEFVVSFGRSPGPLFERRQSGCALGEPGL